MQRRRQHPRPILIAITLASLVAAVVGVAPVFGVVPVSVVFNPTDAEQSWTVPSGVTSIRVDLIGAQGSGGGGFPGGYGHAVSGDLSVTPGSTLYVEVGGRGLFATPGFNGGGAAGTDPNGTAGSGGGASDIRTISRDAPGTLASRLMVAGGGGGAGRETSGGNAGSSGGGGTLGGGPGTESAGGAGGVGDQPGAAGALGVGGAGGSWCTNDVCGSGTAGGGGGGGYYGGGGGAGPADDFFIAPSGAGGGGSSYTGSATSTSVSVETELDASITITYTPESPTTSDELFISEYVDGTSPNQAIEIYNGTGATVDLGSVGYQLEIYANGSPTPTSTVSLAGSVANGDVFVVVRDGSADLFFAADQLAAGLNFTGNDAVALRRSPGGALLDIIGQIGVDPGITGWGSGEQITNDRTLVRKPSITAGRTVNGPFDPATEWNVFSFNSFDFLGYHTVDAGGGTPDPTVGPTPGPDSGTVDATISMATSVCIELSTNSVDFGTGRFGQVGVAGSPDIVVTNCGPDSITLFARGTDATATGASWNLVKNAATCADTLGTDNFHLHLRENQTPGVDWDLGTSNTELEDVAAGSVADLGPSIDTACPGSSGAGQQMAMQIIFTATEAQP